MAAARDKALWTLPGAEDLRRRDERLLALDELASRLAHDFNNLQAPVLGYLTLLQEECGHAQPAGDYLRAMERAGRHSQDVLERLLHAVRPQRAFRRERTDMTVLLAGELEQWKGGLPPDAGITAEFDAAPCVVSIDPRHWQRVVRELLANARSALAAGGLLRVKLAPCPLDDAAAAALGIAGDPVFQLVFQDTGVGMDAETARRAFDPMFTTRGKQKAAGLGLTFVHAAVRLQGGQIKLHSEPGAGTTVTIWLPDFPQEWKDETPTALPGVVATVPSAPTDQAGPRMSPPAAHTTFPDRHETTGSAAGNVPATSPAHGGGAVSAGKNARGLENARLTGRDRLALVVDDNALVLDTVATALRRSGWKVLTAGSGTEALALCRRYAARIAVVVSDVTMPEMNGFELVSRLREQHSKLPVLFISGDVQTVPQEYLETLPGTPPRLLKKPFPVSDLVEAVFEAAG